MIEKPKIKSHEYGVVIQTEASITLDHKAIMKLIGADACQGCPIRSLICRKKWKEHPSFQCHGLVIVQDIINATRGEKPE